MCVCLLHDFFVVKAKNPERYTTMANQIATIVEKIKAELGTAAHKEGQAVLSVIETARLFVELKQSAGKRAWERSLRELDIHPRTAYRYLVIGQCGWTSSLTQGSHLLTQLPCDLQKLEWLSRLSQDQLAHLLKVVSCKDASRGCVIQAVQRLIGEQPSASEERQITIDVLKKRWANYVNRLVEDIEDLVTEEIDATTRQQLLEEFSSKFYEIEEMLTPREVSLEQASAEDASDQIESQNEGRTTAE
jgi:hypothetical protein